MNGEPEVWTADPVIGRWIVDPLANSPTGSALEDIVRGVATALLVALVLANIAVWSFV